MKGIGDEEWAELHRTFLEEARERTDNLEALLLEAHAAGTASPERLNELFREAHSIKGAAGLYGHEAIRTFLHAVEHTLDEARSGAIDFESELARALLDCADRLRRKLDAIDAPDDAPRDAPDGGSSDVPASLSDDRLLERLAQISGLDLAGEPDDPDAARNSRNSQADAGGAVFFQASDATRDGTDAGQAVANGSEAREVFAKLDPEMFQAGFDPGAFLRYLQRSGNVAEPRLDPERLPAVADFDPEKCYVDLNFRYASASGSHAAEAEIRDAFSLADDLIELRIIAAADPGESAAHTEPTDAPSGGEASELSRRRTGPSIRVDAGRLDRAVDQLGEAVILSASLSELSLSREDEDLEELAYRLGRALDRAHQETLQLRMAPLGAVFQRFRRLALDLSRSQNRPAELHTSGAEIELDRNIIDAISEPLTHLITNSIVHGLEDPEERRAVGKPEIGRLELSVQRRSGEVQIELRDDGRGLDRAAILDRAGARGLPLPESDADDEEVFQLLFEPGFSTAREVSELAGRGVGLDAVRRALESLRGRVRVSSEPGRGSRFALQLPPTLAKLDAFLFFVGDNPYAAPIDSVVECLEITDETAFVGEQQLLLYRETTIPWLDLHDSFSEPRPPAGARRNLIIVRDGEARAGLIVDELRGRLQTLMKPPGEAFEKLRGASGFVILPDGSLALALDIAALLNDAVRRRRRTERQFRPGDPGVGDASPKARPVASRSALRRIT